MKRKFLSGALLIALQGMAQTEKEPSPLTFSAYLEGYYSYDFGNPVNHTRPSFTYSHNRHNEVNLNLGLVKASYQAEKVRANLALAAGTYMNANYAAEPGVLKNIFEGNVGVKLSKNKNLWIDAGILPSHIGFESAIGKDCWTLTRSILADNSPYFETGAKLSYSSDNDKWFIAGLVMNGWQRIQRIDGNNTPAFGHQLTFKPNEKVLLNSSSFVGNDKPDSVRQMRYFHNLYGVFQLTDHFGITVGFDIGAEQKSKGSKAFNSWYSPVLILKMSPDAKNNIALRGEYYSDSRGVIIPTGTPNGFQTWGYSLNYDRIMGDHLIWRIEGRGFSGKDETFVRDSYASKSNIFVTTSLAVSL